MVDLLRNPWVVIGIILVVLIGGSVWYSNGVTTAANEGVTITSHIKGNSEASVTLVEYSDFQCPACKGFESVVQEVLTAYGDQISFEYKHFPLLTIHPNAEAAARAAEAAAQQGKFFEYHDMLFAKQDEWATAKIPGAYFVQYAETLGLDVDQFKRQQRSSVISDAVRQSYNDARDMGLTSTPSFFLNGEKMTIETYSDFVAQIEAAIGVSAPETATGTSSDTETTTSAASSVEFGI